ncbi:MAG TPA: WalW protein [Alphaproteobacteria bacterium]|nr:WalW protein [Alphaproteobacteria bacterium]
MVVVDTEEEFDWSAPFDRRQTSVQAMAEIHRCQDMCDRFGIRPIYVMDYPVANQEAGWRPLKELIDGGRAVMGAHLHPWVTPPLVEELTYTNSFPGNLPVAVEREKLTVLTQKIQTVMGCRPRIYKAGRYGIGPNTPAILHELGYVVDLSPAPPFSFLVGGGPDFSLTSNHPQRMADPSILSFPATGDFIGGLANSRRRANQLYRFASSPRLKRLRLPGILSRTRLLERIRLSPEGHSADDLERLTVTLLQRGLTVFSLTLHSPSFKPGCTPYVRDRRDLEQFMETLKRYFHFFIDVLEGVSATPLELGKRFDVTGEAKHIMRPRMG